MAIREIILDTETTGLDFKSGHKIIEIGAVEMIDRRLTGRKYHQYINPSRAVSHEAYKIHGISDSFLEGRPKFCDIADAFLAFVGTDSRFVIHNARFDVGFLNHELTLIGKPSFNLADAVDTLTIARAKFPGHRASLDALCRRYKIDLSGRIFHGALKDATLLARVYLLLTDYSQQLNLTKELQPTQNFEPRSLAEYKTRVVIPTQPELANWSQFVDTIVKKL